MLALFYYKNRDIRLEKVKKPSVSEGEVLLKVTDAGLCQTQLNEFIEGPLLLNTIPNPLTDKALPLIVGHEYGGYIEAVAKDVDTSLIGKQFAVLPLMSCGECQYCLEHEEQLCDSLAYRGLTGADGGFSEYSIVSPKYIFPINDSALLTFLEPILVAVHFARKIEQKLLRAKVLILGAGALGITSAVVLKELFHAEVEVNDNSFVRTQRAMNAGLNMKDKSELRLKDYDIVVDCAGTDLDSSIDSAFVESFKYLSKQGTLVSLGSYFHSVPILPTSIIVQEQNIIGTFAYNSKDVEWLKTRIHDIKFDFSKIIDEISLKNIIEEGYYRGEVDKDSFTRIVVKC